ncbi:hypothetical protein KIP69_14540 [Geobacter sulfurreducens]|jgi:hypothetical protein|uniref:J domain-containing protein n=1 Tax=Geobacter sulfurreducens (strain ATCC 51573 / DSM 12127 / PCA) TaxID=243231 RepID=Q748L3_GEOSL|nr:hypothetical protein [Geobacter sulfurreducens]AAR36380.1 hypothetical protein GSU2988 [Geobacter sulfurreducens PCA]ADI85743.1 hypothetical protein KN400_2931 [Geobacter sulfurreducens KN400]AJY69239.1 hypothetical protein RW64_06285 [Geobacter sulfurreducens]QVW34796.1 hypothetical protein KIP69_14540 [Geobacter sulfurreducens]UAC03664.1 hypothetical protein KVP06_15015 [Geobacter sulfurreducens]
MRTGYHRTTTPDEQELERKRREFHALERRLSRLEHDLEDLREEIREFEQLYADKMADRISELDQLKAELARARRQAAMADGEERTAEGERDGFSEERRFEERGGETETEIPRVKPATMNSGTGESLRDVYRRVAKAIHPDLAENDENRRLRQKLMAEANRAYAEEDRVTLHAIMEEWEAGPEMTVVVGMAGQLELVNRRIARVIDRIRSVERETAKLRNSDIYRLVQRVQEARWRGRDIIAEMAAKLDAEILAACRHLNEVSQVSPRSDAPPEPINTPQASLRTVRFPTERSLGVLYVRDLRSGSFLDWKRLGEAMGDVAVPTGKALRLDVPEGDTGSLDLLGTLAPHDLQACFLYGAGDDDLTHLLKLIGIEEIYLSGAGISGEGLAHLLELKGLERLYLYDTSVTDAGLMALRHLPRLRSVTLCNAPVTEHGIDRLKLSLPACRVVVLRSGGKA